MRLTCANKLFTYFTYLLTYLLTYLAPVVCKCRKLSRVRKDVNY